MHPLYPPIMWRYFIVEYTKTLLICTFGIIALLLTTKLENIAHFIALGAPLDKTFTFVLYQIPYMLQITLPLSSLVSAFSLFARMSTSGELIALRAAGQSIRSLLIPLIMFTLFLGICMMWGLFDISAKSRLATKQLEFDVRHDEPLTFVQNSRYFFKHGAAMELAGSLRTGETAQDLLLCLPSHKNNRLSLMIIKQARTKHNSLHGNFMTVITSNPPEPADRPFGTLLLENADKKKTPIETVHELTQNKTWKVSPEHIALNVLRAKKEVIKQEINTRLYKGRSIKKQSTLLARFTSEPFRRLYLSFGIFTLFLVGAVTGIRTNRNTSRILHTLRPIVCFGLFIGLYLAGKNIDERAYVAIALYLLSHPILITYAYRRAAQIELGKG